MTKHTPTPWTASQYGVFAGKNCIATTDTDNATNARYEANAAYIVKAVNERDSLINLLEKVVSAHTTGDYYDRGRKVDDLIADITAALSKAKE